MKTIELELNYLKKELVNNFLDPFANKELENFMIEGSKFIRSTLVILYLKALGFNVTDEIYQILSAGEMLHSASLLHDDVIDNSDIRRNKTTFSKKYSDKISILAGDFLLSDAIKFIIKLKDDRIINIFLNCTKKMVESEIKQFFLRGKKTSEAEYLEICTGKTAGLFAAVLESSAIITKIDVIKAKKLGELFGICFQIKNDLDNDSAQEDFKNKIYTAKDVLGIEKTMLLLDNYKEEMSKLLKDIPDNIYKKELEDLIKNL